MNDYRNDVKHVIKEGRWTFWKAFPSVLAIIVVVGALGFGANSLGLFGSTFVERKVFETSYQKHASINARIANDQAVLTEINTLLSNPGLDENTVYNLQAQAAAARIRIATAKQLR